MVFSMKTSWSAKSVGLAAAVAFGSAMAHAGTCVSDPVTIGGSGNLMDGIIQTFSSFAVGLLLLFK